MGEGGLEQTVRGRKRKERGREIVWKEGMGRERKGVVWEGVRESEGGRARKGGGERAEEG
jgi:hypothetical protein